MGFFYELHVTRPPATILFYSFTQLYKGRRIRSQMKLNYILLLVLGNLEFWCILADRLVQFF